jgi:hypothetical protein
MTTQEKFDLIPAHYLPKFINSDKTLVSLSIPQYVGIDIDKAVIKVNQGSIIINVGSASLSLSTTLNSVTINII